MRSRRSCISKLSEGRYRVWVEAQRDPRTGKRTRLTKTVRGTLDDAKRAELELRVKAGSYDGDGSATFRDFCEAVYLPAKKREVKQLTYEAYCRRLRLHVYPWLGDTRLRDITPRMLKAHITGTQAQRRETRRMLRMALQHAVYMGEIPSNPADGVKPPKVRKYQPEVLDLQDIEVYLWHFRGTRAEPIFLLALSLGLRRGEICALDVSDINPVTGAVTVSKEVVYTSELGNVTDAPKSADSVRTVHLPKSVLARLMEILPEGGPVCRTLDGRRLAPNSVTRLYEDERDRLPPDVPRISLKNLRHTSLTLAYDSGADILAVATRAGHSDTRITERYYVRPHGDRDEGTAEGIDRALGAVRPERDSACRTERPAARIIPFGKAKAASDQDARF